MNTSPDIHLTQAQLLAHIAHLAQVGSCPPPVQVRFAPEHTEVHITCEGPDDAASWGEWIGAGDYGSPGLVHLISRDWHGWITSVWVQPTGPFPMTPRYVAAALLES